jgi:isoquinoline 1-oxidoreductase beta subunit
MTYMPQISRRSFVASVAALGGGLALGFHLPTGGGPAQAAAGAAEVNAWVMIQPDDTVVIRVARSEMGQGIATALPMLVAEELECDWSKVRAEFPSPDENLRRKRAWGDMSTGGSRSVRTSHEYLRKAGAAAREMLIAAAVQRWNVPAAECQAAKSVITHKPSGRTLRFGEVAEAAAKLPPPAEPKLKDPKDWTLMGTPQKRLDTMDKVTGKPIFGSDVRVPDMLYAAIVQCPVFGGTPKSYDEDKIRSLKGVRRVVPLPNSVAVVADSWWQAKQAIDALPVTWDERQNGKVSSAAIAELLRGGLIAPEAAVVRKDGDFEGALSKATNRVEAEYAAPYLAHATMEPMNCTAHVTADKVEVWAPTQSGEGALAAAAAAAEVAPEKVVMHKTMLGGGFGRRGAVQDYVHQAVMIAKAVGQPVKLYGRARRTSATTSIARRRWSSSPPGSTRRGCRSPGACGSPARRSSAASCRSVLSTGSIRPRPTASPTRWLMTCLTIKSSTPCEPRMCRSASGARSIIRKTASSASALSTRWRMPRARTPTNTAEGC